ncbi:uncharacterized protein DS421_17g595230 [Arachis hypogaea]|nr:uncharacterized protein DS421_17g595230 [Arachis hypogaea]
MCSSGWCGRHEIRYPFRLNNSSQSHCGEHRYTLSCENDNQLFLYLKSIKFQVQSINYNNYTIRLVDANVALHSRDHSYLLPYSLASYNFTHAKDEPYDWFYKQHNDVIILTKQMLYLKCPPYGVKSSATAGATTCMNGSYSLGSTFYVSDIDKTLQDLAFGDSCHIEWMYLTSWPTEIKHTYISCTDNHHMLLYGFELSWLKAYCKNDDPGYAMLSDHKVICYKPPLMPKIFLLPLIVGCLVYGTSKPCLSLCAMYLFFLALKSRHRSMMPSWSLLRNTIRI